MTVFQPASGMGATVIQLDAFICHLKSCRGKKGHKHGSSGKVLCESLGGGVPLGHLSPYPLLKRDELYFASEPYSRLGIQNPTLSPTNYFQFGNFITIVVQQTLTKSIYYSSRTPVTNPCSRLNHPYTGHFYGKLYAILNQNCLISIPCPGL